MHLLPIALCTVIWIMLGGSRNVLAQEKETSSRTLDISEAISIALQQTADVRRAEHSRRLQETIVKEQRAAFLPNLSVSLGSNRRYGLTFDQTAGELVSTSSESMNAGASARVNLFNGFADVAALDQAKHDRARSEHQYERTRHQIVFQVLSRYLDVVLDREQIAIQEEALAAQEEQLSRIEAFTELGERPTSDLYQQRAQVAQRELQLLNARQSLSTSKTLLVETLQLDPEDNYTFVAPPLDEESIQVTGYNLSDLLNRAYRERADLWAQREDIAAAREGIRIARSGYWPTIDLSGQVGTSYTSNNPFDFTNQVADNRSGAVGILLSVSLFDRLTTHTQVERAEVQYHSAQLDRESLQDRHGVRAGEDCGPSFLW